MSQRSFSNGRKVVTTAGTAERLVAAANTDKCGSMIITAEEDNTGDIVIGASDVDETPATRIGHLLTPGSSFTIDGGEDGNGGRLDPYSLYIDAEVNGDGVHWLAMS